ncbi:hypothetical protein FBULB1_14370, partial [Fusarium bulbicola]
PQVSLRKHIWPTTSMAANEISDQRFEEIIQVVGRPSDRSPGNYNERLEKETSKDNILIPFLKRASDIDMETPLQSPTEWLQKLTAASFADPVDINNLTFPGALSLHPKPTKTPTAHSALVSLSIELVSHITPRLEHSQSQPLPSLVLPIGQLQKKYINTSGIPSLIDTDYILVVDAAGTSHAVWLIYDRYQRCDYEFKDLTDPKRTPLVFMGLEKNFDAAQVFPSIKDWIEAYGKVSEADFLDSLKKTGLVGEVRVMNATTKDLTALENK